MKLGSTVNKLHINKKYTCLAFQKIKEKAQPNNKRFEDLFICWVIAYCLMPSYFTISMTPSSNDSESNDEIVFH